MDHLASAVDEAYRLFHEYHNQHLSPPTLIADEAHHAYQHFYNQGPHPPHNKGHNDSPPSAAAET